MTDTTRMESENEREILQSCRRKTDCGRAETTEEVLTLLVETRQSVFLSSNGLMNIVLSGRPRQIIITKILPIIAAT